MARTREKEQETPTCGQRFSFLGFHCGYTELFCSSHAEVLRELLRHNGCKKNSAGVSQPSCEAVPIRKWLLKTHNSVDVFFACRRGGGQLTAKWWPAVKVEVASGSCSLVQFQSSTKTPACLRAMCMSGPCKERWADKSNGLRRVTFSINPASLDGVHALSCEADIKHNCLRKGKFRFSSLTSAGRILTCADSEGGSDSRTPTRCQQWQCHPQHHAAKPCSVLHTGLCQSSPG